jgi:hypothetical protein
LGRPRSFATGAGIFQITLPVLRLSGRARYSRALRFAFAVDPAFAGNIAAVPRIACFIRVGFRVAAAYGTFARAQTWARLVTPATFISGCAEYCGAGGKKQNGHKHKIFNYIFHRKPPHISIKLLLYFKTEKD